MAISASTGAIETALEEMSTMLEADDYQLSIGVFDGLVRLVVRAGPDACEDCLVPKELFASMALSMLASADIAIAASDLDVTYPAEAH